ncbi:uncharacterized protein LOC125859018 [Solanum stenotomum]|uniref:uncharacterized protein LOC125859018 n=1 Tax=Solanum stenotomum TaxID=172797 RepID=UPI0020D16843|nr:uncharacterized protein LOC125859018 [Solanum stenotomum]
MEVKEKQCTDPILLHRKENVQHGMTKALELTQAGVLQRQNILCVPNVNELRNRIMMEEDNSRYFVHPGSTKLYHDLKEMYWLGDMKKNITKFVVQCPNCQQVKVEHQKPGGYMQSIELPILKWDVFNMDFVTGLPRSFRKFDYIQLELAKCTRRLTKRTLCSPFVPVTHSKAGHWAMEGEKGDTLTSMASSSLDRPLVQ